MADSHDAPTAHPTPPPTFPGLYPTRWHAPLADTPAVNPLDARGLPTPDAEVLTLSGAVNYAPDTGAPDGVLVLRLNGVPARHAQALAHRVLWSLWPGVGGFVDRGAGSTTRSADTDPRYDDDDTDPRYDDDDTDSQYLDRDRLVANIASLTESLVSQREAHAAELNAVNAKLDAAIAEVRQQGADAVELERAALAHAHGEIEAARTAALNAEGAADRLRVEVREAAKRLKDTEALVRAHEATIAGLRDAAEVSATQYQDNLAGVQETQGRALDAARARAAEADREATAARAAHVQLAAEYEALKADAEALRVELAAWKARALDAERGAPTAAPVSAEAETAIASRVAAEVAAEWSARLAAEVNRREAAEAAVKTMRGLLDATTPPGPPQSIATPPVTLPAAHTAAPLPIPAPRTGGPGVPFAAPVAPLVPMPAPIPAPAPAPFAGLPAVGARVAPEAVAPMPASPVVSIVDAPAPVLPPPPPADVLPAVESLIPPPSPVPGVIAEGLAPLPVPPAPVSGADAELAAFGITPDAVLLAAAEDARTRKYFHEVVRAIVERVRPKRPGYDFAAAMSDLSRVHGMTGQDNRPLVPALTRVPVASLRERLASVVAQHADIGLALPAEV